MTIFSSSSLNTYEDMILFAWSTKLPLNYDLFLLWWQYMCVRNRYKAKKKKYYLVNNPFIYKVDIHRW